MDPDSDYYRQDLLQPFRIEHGFDFMLGFDGEGMEYAYNFLDYYFIEKGRQVTARHYLDQPGEIGLNITSRDELESEFVQKILVFLGMRYSSITWPTEKGYETLPYDIEKNLAERIRAHIEANGHL